jgi:asparagine synthase (glutamine-hydrolysing)
MPGICGVIDLRPEADLPPLAGMMRPLRPHAWFVSESNDEHSGVRLGAVSLDRSGRQPHLATSSDGSQVCVLDGEFYDRNALRREFASLEEGAESDAALMLSGWRNYGKSFLRRLNGSFAAVIWNANARTATLISDRFGSRILYYARVGRRLLFGSRMKSLVVDPAVSREVNPRGMAQFFTFGIYLRDDTSLEAVRVLPAAACSSWEADTANWRQDTYHQWSESYATTFGSREEWIARIGDTLHDSVQRQTENTAGLGLSLSGGLDARTILAMVNPSGSPLTTVCSAIRGSLDHRCAAELSRIAGCPNHAHVLDTAFLGEYRRHLDRMVELTDGQYLSQCIVMPTLPLYRELGIEVLMRGHAGELMHMYKAYNYSLDEEALTISSSQQLDGWLLKRLQAFMLHGLQRPVFASHLQGQLSGLAHESLQADLAEVDTTEPVPQRIWNLFVTQRLRRETVLSMNKFRSVAETRLPLYDNELVALLLAAPPELKLGEEIQAKVLKRFRPEFLRVVNANTGTSVGAGPWSRKFSSLFLRGMAKLGVPGYQPYERLGLWLRRELADIVRDVLLDTQTLDRGLYDADGIKVAIENHLTGRRNHTYLIMALMIFELGQRYLTAGPESDQDGEAMPMTPLQGVAT